ncbi:MAG: hypothetical protein KF778_05675 [Rhodocyclaceae bacterium]|nr:hypothetical protein [Rhodocyclaceae bacterium]MBX3667873.1 hypothetical protein [Rhodocyclaceae bacterium]
MQISLTQLQDHLLADRERLANDLVAHLREVKPALFLCYPLPYLHWVACDSLLVSEPFRLDDVYALRTFFRLRFEIAPGFYKEPRIAAVLRDASLAGIQRFERLAQPEFSDAWLAAQQFDGPIEWRSRYWGMPT